MKHLLSIADLERPDIERILEVAESFEEISGRDIKKVPTLRGRTVVNLFYESSTRTSSSFELAAKRLSADLISVRSAGSAVDKGESLQDTVATLSAYDPAAIVIRSPWAGAAQIVARSSSASVVNAGDGKHEHPSQALLDLFTLRRRIGSLDGLHIWIVGDVMHSRVARSAIHGMKTMGMTVTVAGPPTLIPPACQELGVKVSHRLDEAIAHADVIMMLRLQHERMQAGLIPSVREYSRVWGLGLEKLEHCRPDVLIMHPGPVNRGVELSPEVADGPYSVILDQVANGVAVRMAVLYLLAGSKAA